jgi:hypothetical protein
VGRPWLSQTSCGLDRADLLWFGQRRAGVVLPKVGATRQRLKPRIGVYSDWLAGPSLVREPSQSGRPWSLPPSRLRGWGRPSASPTHSTENDNAAGSWPWPRALLDIAAAMQAMRRQLSGLPAAKAVANAQCGFERHCRFHGQLLQFVSVAVQKQDMPESCSD